MNSIRSMVFQMSDSVSQEDCNVSVCLCSNSQRWDQQHRALRAKATSMLMPL